LFFSHYLLVRAHIPESSVTKNCIYAIYRHMMPDEFRYDYANFSNALYDWAYTELLKQPGASEAIDDAVNKFEAMKASRVRKPKLEKTTIETVGQQDSGMGEEPQKKRQRKRKSPEELAKDKFKNLLRNSSTVTFTSLKPIETLDLADKWTQVQSEHLYTLEQLHEWELIPASSGTSVLLSDGGKSIVHTKNTKVPLTYVVKEDETQFIVFANVPYFVQGTLAVCQQQNNITLEGAISLPPLVNVQGKQVDISQLTDVETPRQNHLHMGRFKQVIELPRPINPTCSVGTEGGLVIVVVEKQVFNVNKTML